MRLALRRTCLVSRFPLTQMRMLWLRKRKRRRRLKRKNNVQADRKGVHTRTLGLVQVAIMNVITNRPERAYGTAIADEVSRDVGRELADAQVYVALRKLEEHGLISSRVDEIPMPSKKSRGRPRKYYASTAKGQRALESAGAYTLSRTPFMQSSTAGGVHEGTKKARCQPPWWCRAALYAAVWPRIEFYDYRIRLQRRYLRLVRDEGIKSAKRYARREALSWFWAFGWRVARSTIVFHVAK